MSNTTSGNFAVIKTGGKQYRIMTGQKLTIEKLEPQEGTSVIFDQVLLRSTGDKLEIGAPYIVGAKVEAKLLGGFKDRTKIVFKYHAKARYKKKKGHRQPHTEVEIVKI